MRDTVSIIIPTYGRAEFLKRAIDSCINQTYKNIEIIVVDDNNIDSISRRKTEKLMELYLNDKRVIYIKHFKNKGGSVARNTGIRNSKGSFISFLDDDDEYHEERIKKCLDYCKKKQIKGVITNYTSVTKRKTVKSKIQKKELNLYSILSKNLNIGTGSNLFFSKDILLKMNGFDKEFIRHQDIEIMVRFLSVNKLGLIKENLVTKYEEDKQNYPNPYKLLKIKELFFQKFEKEISGFSCEKSKKIKDVHRKEIIREYFKNQNFVLGWKERKKIFRKKTVSLIEVFKWVIIGIIKKCFKWVCGSNNFDKLKIQKNKK